MCENPLDTHYIHLSHKCVQYIYFYPLIACLTVVIAFHLYALNCECQFDN